MLALLSSAHPELTEVEASLFRRSVWRAIAANSSRADGYVSSASSDYQQPRLCKPWARLWGLIPLFGWCHAVRSCVPMGVWATSLWAPLSEASLLLWERRVLALSLILNYLCTQYGRVFTI